MATHKSISEPSYGVHRPTDDGPSSSHPSREEEQEEQEDHRSTTPPPYSGPTTSTMSIPRTRPPAQKHYPGLPKLDYKLYCPRNFTLYKDQTTLKSSDPLLSTNPKELVALIQQLATVPPKPQIRIRGTSPGGVTVHFDLKINMMGLIVPDDREKKSMNYVRIIAPGEKGWRGEIRETIGPNVGGGLEEWAKLFCRDSAAIKQFTLQRIVTNWDTNYLEGRLLSLISSTSYKGHTEITFPITHTHVTIKSPDKVNRFFSNVTSLFTGVKRYEIVKSVWPYADTERSFASSGGGFAGGRTCCVQSEDTWFEEWKDCIRYAVLGRRNGWVTGEDRLEVLMEPRGDEGVKPEEWGTS